MFRRCFDFGVAVVGLAALSPLLALVGALIRLDDGGPALFTQTRLGRGRRPFRIYKFRTMRDGCITRHGRWLRATGIDELPQLLNLVRGEMSLIGPRPALPEEVARYEPWHRRRLEVQPGCAGLAQALGRSDMSFDEQIRLDIYYAENWSLSMDLRILLMVVPAVITGRGAY